MPQITVTTTIVTVFDVPEGVPIERIRQLALSELSESGEDPDDPTEGVFRQQQRAIAMTFYGDEEPRSASIEHSISELSDCPACRPARPEHPYVSH